MMIRMRRFEEAAYKMFMRNLVKGTSHLGIGQEAVAAASRSTRSRATSTSP